MDLKPSSALVKVNANQNQHEDPESGEDTIENRIEMSNNTITTEFDLNDSANDSNEILEFSYDYNESNSLLEQALSKPSRHERYKCSFCDYKTAKKSHLTRHVRIHTGEKPFNCNFCDYKSAQKASLSDHLKTHTGEKPFNCTFCNYKCALKAKLTLHLKNHTSGRISVTCAVCDLKCVGKTELSDHMKTHGEKPFECSFCEYKSTRKLNLIRHLQTHLKEKPLKCTLCDYKCSAKFNLTRHMKTHTREKPVSRGRARLRKTLLRNVPETSHERNDEEDAKISGSDEDKLSSCGDYDEPQENLNVDVNDLLENIKVEPEENLNNLLQNIKVEPHENLNVEVNELLQNIKVEQVCVKEEFFDFPG